MPDKNRRILILFAHPAYEKSRVNRVLLKEVRDLPGVTFHDLYENYPDFAIDVEREQELLVAHDVVVFHHPFFWYSTPAILKEWQDLVLQHGWAYGHSGTALRGKVLMNVLTTGGGESAYQAEGHNRFTIRQFLAPLEQTARLCGMNFLPPFVAHGTHGMKPAEMDGHGKDLRRLMEALRDGLLDPKRFGELPRINADLDAVLNPPASSTNKA